MSRRAAVKMEIEAAELAAQAYDDYNLLTKLDRGLDSRTEGWGWYSERSMVRIELPLSGRDVRRWNIGSLAALIASGFPLLLLCLFTSLTACTIIDTPERPGTTYRQHTCRETAGCGLHPITLKPEPIIIETFSACLNGIKVSAENDWSENEEWHTAWEVDLEQRLTDKLAEYGRPACDFPNLLVICRLDSPRVACEP